MRDREQVLERSSLVLSVDRCQGIGGKLKSGYDPDQHLFYKRSDSGHAQAISKEISALYVYGYFLTTGDGACFSTFRAPSVSRCSTGQVCVEGPENVVFVRCFSFKALLD